MRTDANYRRFGLEDASDPQQVGTTSRILQSHVDIREQPPWTFNAEYPINEQASLQDFCA